MTLKAIAVAALVASCAGSPPAAVTPAADANGRLAGKNFGWTLSGRAAERAQCREQWSFDADGIVTVQSGEETVTKKFRLQSVPGDSMLSLTMVRLTKNGRPDCMGNAMTTVGQERRIFLQFLNDGSFFTCASTDGLSCYGVASPR